MNTSTKLIAAMKQSPQADWTMQQLLSLAQRHHIEVRSTGGSHHVFSHLDLSTVLTVPARRPIKAVYIKQFVALVEQSILANEAAAAKAQKAQDSTLLQTKKSSKT
jgi:predicted RNA binding protein YcfA (HicA-like mRNA interferase family)